MKSKSLSINFISNYLFINEYLVGITLAIFLIIQKVPFILYNGQINPDESQMLAQAITLEFDPVFWRSVDGTTSGPINSYLILLLKLFGFPFNYSTLHLLSVCLVIISLMVTYHTLRIFFNIKASFSSLFIIYGFIFFTNHKDFNHYNSELPSVTLITIVVFILARIYYSNNPSHRLFGALGVICCLIPLAKLQGIPFAFLYIMFTCIYLLRSEKQISYKLARMGFIGLGAIVTIGLLVYYLYYNRIIYDFYIMYIKTNLIHNNPGNGLNLFIKLIFKSSYDFLLFFIFSIALWVISIVTLIFNNNYRSLNNKIFLFLITNIITSLFVVARTGYIFEHYLFYTFFPITLLNAYFLNQITEFEIFKNYSQIVFKYFIIVFFAGISITSYLKYYKINQNFTASQSPLNEIRVINLINRYTKPTDCIVVWGWNLTYHVLTGLRQGTRENHSIRCMNTNSLGAIRDPQLIDYYCQQYVNDMERNNPVIFIDEVRANTFFDHPNMVVHLKVPRLRKYVADNYKLISIQSGVFVYVRKDRL